LAHLFAESQPLPKGVPLSEIRIFCRDFSIFGSSASNLGVPLFVLDKPSWVGWYPHQLEVENVH